MIIQYELLLKAATHQQRNKHESPWAIRESALYFTCMYLRKPNIPVFSLIQLILSTNLPQGNRNFQMNRHSQTPSSSCHPCRTTTLYIKGKGNAVLLQAWSGPEGSGKLRYPDYMTMAQDGGKVVSLKHRLPLPSGNAPGTYFC
jgi:hypothetical protein